MKKKVLFLCTQNSVRSQIAESFLRVYYKDKYDTFSAGSNPSKINPYAIEVMKEIGFDISNQKSKNIQELKDIKFDIVVTLCNNTKETCPTIPGKKVLHKSFDDPTNFTGSDDETLDIFRKTRDEIKDWIIDTFSSEKIL